MLQVNSTVLNMKAIHNRLSCASLASFDHLEFKLKLLPHTQAFPPYSLQYKELQESKNWMRAGLLLPQLEHPNWCLILAQHLRPYHTGAYF